MFAARAVRTAPGFGRRAASAIALKYSNALFGAALSKSPQTLTKIQTELAAVSAAIAQDAKVSAFVANPTLSANERAAGLASLYSTLESKKTPVSEITKNLLLVLSQNGRLGEAPGVIEGFNELVAAHNGELTVTVTSAAPLPRDVQTRLETTLKQSETAKQAKSVKIVNKVNPTVLGGLIVDFGDKTVDLSVQSRITKLNSVLTQSV
ncbi:OSCP, subunit 5 of the stator stalk of mitochondrial F1F0 ATP synthase [Cylindrobasidium torrendii FP15055 ss-10]|uniref:ATP synthase subunit 5, mitochondrial n=1 Tax=Cylindrobasidium torrendii FP15055 ss-10 TaxID=1314674 RepID=A0A0D7BVU1_9AGAR|nr:OSCP, subunit 5 of the stator stalk of mitochondrial F1F0 ATP synthase [Cylindrobasidium torrendii FP15055 ss-10]